MSHQARSHVERRRHRRLPVAGMVRYQCNREESGEAAMIDADHKGLGLLTTHPFASGQRLMLKVRGQGRDGELELKGFVVWSAPANTPGLYRTGVRVYHDAFETQVALCAVICAGLKKAAEVAELRDRRCGILEWKLATMETNATAAESNDGWRRPVGRGDLLIRAVILSL